MPLFRSSPKSPQELVKNLDEALKVMRGSEGGGKKAEKASIVIVGCVSLYLYSGLGVCIATPTL